MELISKKQKIKGIIGWVFIFILSAIGITGFFFAIQSLAIGEDSNTCYYELKDGTTCKTYTIGYSPRLEDCSDLFIHLGEPYKEVCK